MRTLPIPPRPGEKVSATLIREIIRAIGERTPIAGHGVKVSIGPNGSVISSDAVAKTQQAIQSDPLHPWKVVGVQKTDECDHLFEIYTSDRKAWLPIPNLVDDMTGVNVSGLTAIDGRSGWYTLDCEDEISESATLYVIIYVQEENDNRWMLAKAVVDPDSFAASDEVDAVYAVVPIADLSIETDDDNNESGTVDLQRRREDISYPAVFYV